MADLDDDATQVTSCSGDFYQECFSFTQKPSNGIDDFNVDDDCIELNNFRCVDKNKELGENKISNENMTINTQATNNTFLDVVDTPHATVVDQEYVEDHIDASAGFEVPNICISQTQISMKETISHSEDISVPEGNDQSLYPEHNDDENLVPNIAISQSQRLQMPNQIVDNDLNSVDTINKDMCKDLASNLNEEANEISPNIHEQIVENQDVPNGNMMISCEIESDDDDDVVVSANKSQDSHIRSQQSYTQPVLIFSATQDENEMEVTVDDGYIGGDNMDIKNVDSASSTSSDSNPSLSDHSICSNVEDKDEKMPLEPSVHEKITIFDTIEANTQEGFIYTVDTTNAKNDDNDCHIDSIPVYTTCDTSEYTLEKENENIHIHVHTSSPPSSNMVSSSEPVSDMKEISSSISSTKGVLSYYKHTHTEFDPLSDSHTLETPPTAKIANNIDDNPTEMKVDSMNTVIADKEERINTCIQSILSSYNLLLTLDKELAQSLHVEALKQYLMQKSITSHTHGSNDVTITSSHPEVSETVMNKPCIDDAGVNDVPTKESTSFCLSQGSHMAVTSLLLLGEDSTDPIDTGTRMAATSTSRDDDDGDDDWLSPSSGINKDSSTSNGSTTKNHASLEDIKRMYSTFAPMTKDTSKPVTTTIERNSWLDDDENEDEAITNFLHNRKRLKRKLVQHPSSINTNNTSNMSGPIDKTILDTRNKENLLNTKALVSVTDDMASTYKPDSSKKVSTDNKTTNIQSPKRVKFKEMSPTTTITSPKQPSKSETVTPKITKNDKLSITSPVKDILLETHNATANAASRLFSDMKKNSDTNDNKDKSKNKRDIDMDVHVYEDDDQWNDDMNNTEYNTTTTSTTTMKSRKYEDEDDDDDDSDEDSSVDDLNEHDIPASFTTSTLKELKFANIWKILKSYDWWCKKGSNLVYYYYIRPGREVNSSYKAGIDYFISEEELLGYIMKYARQVVIPNTMRDDKSSKSHEGLSMKDIVKVNQLSYTIDLNKVMGLDSVTSPTSNTSYVIPDTVTSSYPITHNRENTTTSHMSSNQGVDEKVDDDDEDKPQVHWKECIMTLPWSQLWKILHTEEGWTWDYGKGKDILVSEWYIIPGSTSQTARAHIEKFASQEDVRRYLRQLHHPDYQPTIESQMEQHQSKPTEEWQLLSNRRKRKSTPKSYDSEYEYDSSTNMVRDSDTNLLENRMESSKKSTNGISRSSSSSTTTSTNTESRVISNQVMKDDRIVSKQGKAISKDIRVEHDRNTSNTHKVQRGTSSIISTRQEPNTKKSLSITSPVRSSTCTSYLRHASPVRSSTSYLRHASPVRSSTSYLRHASPPQSTSSPLWNMNKGTVRDMVLHPPSPMYTQQDLAMDHDSTQAQEVSQSDDHGVKNRLDLFKEQLQNKLRHNPIDISCYHSPTSTCTSTSDSRSRQTPPRKSHKSSSSLLSKSTANSTILVQGGHRRSPTMAMNALCNATKPRYTPQTLQSTKVSKYSESSSAACPMMTPPQHSVTAFTDKNITLQSGRTSIESSSYPSSSMKGISSKKDMNGYKSTITDKTIRQNNNLFQGLHMIMTGLEERLRLKIQAVISKYGGKMVEEIPSNLYESSHYSSNSTTTDMDRALFSPYSREVRKSNHQKNTATASDVINKETLLVISVPTAFRRHTYLLAIACDIKLVHYSWVTDSLKSNTILGIQSYLLPSGYTSLYPYFVFPSTNTAMNMSNAPWSQSTSGDSISNKIFYDMSVINLVNSSFNPILQASGFTVMTSRYHIYKKLLQLMILKESHSHKPTNTHKGHVAGGNAYKSSKYGRNKNDEDDSLSSIMYILVDPYQYIQAKIKYKDDGHDSITLSTSMSNRYTTMLLSSSSHMIKHLEQLLSALKEYNIDTEYSNVLSTLDISILDTYLLMIQKLSTQGRSIMRNDDPFYAYSIVTLDWLVNCLELNEFLSPPLSVLYQLPNDPWNSPTVFKQHKLNGGDRYSIHDVVEYSLTTTTMDTTSSSPMSSPGPGSSSLSSMKRSTKGKSPLLNVNFSLSPSPVNAVGIGKIMGFQLGEDGEMRIQILPYKYHQRIIEPNRLPLDPSISHHDEMTDVIIIHANMLSRKVSIFTKETYESLKYTQGDDTVYVMSTKWQRTYESSMYHRQQTRYDENDDDDSRNKDVYKMNDVSDMNQRCSQDV